MTEHNRREEYWKFYDHAVVAETAHLRRTLIRLIREKSCLRSEGSNRGRHPIHSKEKLDFACLWMMADNQTYRKTESGMGEMRTPWDGEPVPDHTTLVRHMQTIPPNGWTKYWPQTARRCLVETGGADAPLGADSSGTETTRCEDVERPDKDARGFIGKPRKVSAGSMPYRGRPGAADHAGRGGRAGRPQRCQHAGARAGGDMRRHGFGSAGRLSRADRGYDAEYGSWLIFWMGMIHSGTGQRRGAANRAAPNRRRAAGLFDRDEHRLRALIEGVSGAEMAGGA